MVFHPDREYIAVSGASDGKVKAYNSTARRQTKEIKFSDIWPVKQVAINQDGSLFAAGMGNDYHLGWEGRDKFNPPSVIFRKSNNSTFSASYSGGGSEYSSYSGGYSGSSGYRAGYMR